MNKAPEPEEEYLDLNRVIFDGMSEKRPQSAVNAIAIAEAIYALAREVRLLRKVCEEADETLMRVCSAIDSIGPVETYTARER